MTTGQEVQARPARRHSALSWTGGKAAELFGVDLRSLAALRIVLGLLVIADLILRSTDFYAHYTDAGVLPRSQLIEEGIISDWRFSLFLINGQLFVLVLLFCITGLAALCMVVGYRTRLATIVVWVMLISIQFRNPMLLNGGDVLFRLLLFWCMFLPLGAYWSVDRWRKSESRRPSTQFLSIGTAALLLQIAFMYIFTALLKTGDAWRVDGTALYYALNMDQLVTPFGTWMTQFPDLLRILTFASLGLEAIGPFLLFFPFFTGPVRTAMVLAFMGLHFGIWSMMEIGFFPFISALCMVCFLPAWFWNTAGRRTDTVFPRLLPGIAHAFERTASGLAGVSAAILRGGGFSRAPGIVDPSIAGLSGGEEGRAAASTVEAPRRNDTGGRTGLPGPSRLRSAPLTNLLAAFFLAYVFCWNLTTVTEFEIPERLENVGDFFGLGQTWSMFAPQPSDESSWYVIPGALRGGQRVDLMSVTRDDFHMHPVSWEKPRYLAGIYESNHWRKYMNAVNDFDYPEDARTYFGDYVCDEWNARHKGPKTLRTLRVFSMEQATPSPGGGPPGKPDKDFLWNYRCS